MRIPNIHILGIQGSGKGTQSALIVEKFSLAYISSGNAFRERAEINDEFGNQLKKELAGGHLMADHYLFDMIESFLSTHPMNKGLLGDGVIRTATQYQGLQSIWEQHNLDNPLLIHLELTEKIALERIRKRQEQQAHMSPQEYEYHKMYSGKLVHRTDDNPQAIQKRFALFHRMTKPVIELFELSDRSINISANDTVDHIHEQICASLIKFYPQLANVTY